MADHDLALWNPSENREQDKESCNLNRIRTIGLLIVETIGGLQWHFVGGSMSIPAIAVYSLTAFIPKDIVITVLAVLIAIPIRKGINNAGNR